MYCLDGDCGETVQQSCVEKSCCLHSLSSIKLLFTSHWDFYMFARTRLGPQFALDECWRRCVIKIMADADCRRWCHWWPVQTASACTFKWHRLYTFNILWQSNLPLLTLRIVNLILRYSTDLFTISSVEALSQAFYQTCSSLIRLTQANLCWCTLHRTDSQCLGKSY